MSRSLWVHLTWDWPHRRRLRATRVVHVVPCPSGHLNGPLRRTDREELGRISKAAAENALCPGSPADQVWVLQVTPAGCPVGRPCRASSACLPVPRWPFGLSILVPPIPAFSPLPEIQHLTAKPPPSHKVPQVLTPVLRAHGGVGPVPGTLHQGLRPPLTHPITSFQKVLLINK